MEWMFIPTYYNSLFLFKHQFLDSACSLLRNQRNGEPKHSRLLWTDPASIFVEYMKKAFMHVKINQSRRLIITECSRRKNKKDSQSS